MHFTGPAGHGEFPPYSGAKITPPRIDILKRLRKDPWNLTKVWYISIGSLILGCGKMTLFGYCPFLGAGARLRTLFGDLVDPYM